MDWEAITALATVVGLLSAGLAALVTHSYSNGGHDKDVKSRTRNAESLAQACLAKNELLGSQFAEHKEANAREFAKLEGAIGETSRAQTAAEIRFSKALEDNKDALEHLTDRIDDLISGRKG